MIPTITLLPLVITAGILAVVLLWPRVRSGPAGARLAVEVFASTLALLGLILGLVVVAQRIPW